MVMLSTSLIDLSICNHLCIYNQRRGRLLVELLRLTKDLGRQRRKQRQEKSIEERKEEKNLFLLVERNTRNLQKDLICQLFKKVLRIEHSLVQHKHSRIDMQMKVSSIMKMLQLEQLYQICLSLTSLSHQQWAR